MKRIALDISEILLSQMDEAVLKEGFQSRSEFLRFLIMIHTKKSPDGTAGKTEEMPENEFADVDLEYGIPPEVIEKIMKKVRASNRSKRH